MGRKVKIDLFDPSSIDDAIAEVESLKSKVAGPELVRLIRQLASIGEQYAFNCFAMAVYDGINDVQVSSSDVIFDDGTAKATLTASSEEGTVLFIEFGTGIVFPDSASARAMLEDGSGVVGRGEYGKGNGKKYMWGYYEVPGDKSTLKKTRGNPSNACMYMTYKHLEGLAKRMVEEVVEW